MKEGRLKRQRRMVGEKLFDLDAWECFISFLREISENRGREGSTRRSQCLVES